MSSHGGRLDPGQGLQRAAAEADEGSGLGVVHTLSLLWYGQLLKGYCSSRRPAGFSKVTLLEDCF